MANGNVGKFRTYSQEERGQLTKPPKPERSRNVIVDDDDEDQYDIPARFTARWSK